MDFANMASASSPRNKHNEILALLNKGSKLMKYIQQITVIEAPNSANTETPGLTLKPCEDEPLYFNELMKLVEENKLETETAIKFNLEEKKDIEEFVQKLVVMWATNYCNVYVAEKMKQVDDILITNEDFQEKLQEMSERCVQIKKQIEVLFHIEESEGIDNFKRILPVMPTGLNVQRSVEQMNMLLQICEKNPEISTQESRAREILQQFFEEYNNLVNEYQLASDAAIKVGVESNEEPDLGQISICQKKIMKFAANYCDFYMVEDMTPIYNILTKNQNFYEARNKLFKLCNVIESAVNCYKIVHTSVMDVDEDESTTEGKKADGTVNLDPFSQRPIQNPVTNQVCGHVYEYRSLADMFRHTTVIKCPYQECSNLRTTRQDLIIEIDADSD